MPLAAAVHDRHGKNMYENRPQSHASFLASSRAAATIHQPRTVLRLSTRPVTNTAGPAGSSFSEASHGNITCTWLKTCTRQSPFKGSRSLRRSHPRDAWRNARRIRLGISALPRNRPLDDVRLCGSARGSSLSNTVRHHWRDVDIRSARLGGVVHHARRRRSRVRRRRSIRPRRAARLRLARRERWSWWVPLKGSRLRKRPTSGSDLEQDQRHGGRHVMKPWVRTDRFHCLLPGFVYILIGSMLPAPVKEWKGSSR